MPQLLRDCKSCVIDRSLLTPHRTSALEAFGSGLQWSIGWVFAVAFGSGDGVRLIVLRSVGGVARVKLYKGTAMIAGRKSEHSLYRHELATYE